MTTFRYKGQTAGGAKVSGVLRAYDEFEAADKLRESVAIITKLEAVPEKKESVLSRPVAFRVKEKELALLCSQFAIILASGLSVERCVSMVAAQTKNKYLRRMLDKVSEEVGAGYSLAQSFGNNAPYLPKTFTETLRAGEQSGTLESCFQRLHAYYDRSAKTRAKIVSTLTYPVMVIIVAIVVFVIIIAVAVPAFTDAFTDLGSGSLPGVTRALMAVSAFFTKWWWLVLGVLALLVIAYLTFRRTERGRAALAAWSLTRAPLRRIHSMNAAAQFAHSMATLLAAGLPLPRALEVTANVVSNYTFSLAVRQVRQDVERGRPMAESMAGIECFPAMLTEMVGVGERSGALEETLDVIGGYYDNEVSVTTAAGRAGAGHHHCPGRAGGHTAAGGLSAHVHPVRRHITKVSLPRATPRDDIELQTEKEKLPMLKKLNNKKGFTLMEMLIVVAIIAVLVAIAIPVFNGALTKSKEAADVANVRALYAEWQVSILTENKDIPADKAAFLAGPDKNGATEFTFNYADGENAKLTYTKDAKGGSIKYEATKLADANGSKTYTWTLGQENS